MQVAVENVPNIDQTLDAFKTFDTKRKAKQDSYWEEGLLGPSPLRTRRYPHGLLLAILVPFSLPCTAFLGDIYLSTWMPLAT